MILLNNFNRSSLQFDSSFYHFYIVDDIQIPVASAQVNLSYLDDGEIKNCLQASLIQKKGLFLVKNWSNFEKTCKSELLMKHHYLEKNSWIFLSRSLKNHIKEINTIELLSFGPEQIEKVVKKIFSR